MTKQIFKGAILGGLIFFVWSMISWMALPWHREVLKEFHNEEFVGWVIEENAKTDGIYVIPHPDLKNGEKSYSDAKKPYVFASVSSKHVNMKSPIPYVVSILTQIVAAGFISYLLLKTRGLSYLGRLRFVVFVGLIAGVVCFVPAWNWWRFPGSYTVVEILDLIIGWFLAGLLMAKVVRVPEPPESV